MTASLFRPLFGLAALLLFLPDATSALVSQRTDSTSRESHSFAAHPDRDEDDFVLLAALAVLEAEPVKALGAPLNDNFANAPTITIAIDPTMPPLPTFGDNLNATKEPGEPTHAGNPGGKSVWWKWSTPVPARVQLFSSASDFDTLLAVYTGDAVNALTPVAHDPFSASEPESYVFFARPGVTYSIAVDGVGGASGQITLQLGGIFGTLPSITREPEDASVSFGNPVMMSVGVSGTEPLTYQWYRNGQPWNGQTTNFVYLSTAQSSESGTYQVIVSNPFGSVTSRVATVAVTNPAAPVITSQPVGTTVTPPQQVAIAVGASGAGTLSYQWFFNGSALAGETSPNLRINNPVPSQTGDYHVTVSNAGGTTTSAVVRVTINAPASAPVFTTHPVNQTVAAGSTVSFTAAASGSPDVRYEWRRNGVTITDATSSTLTLSNVSASQAGNYTAVAINSAGSATSNVATLNVNAVTSPPAGGSGGAGGGAASTLFVLALALLLVVRRASHTHRM